MVSSVNMDGARFNALVSAKDVETIKKASDRDHIGNLATRLWDKISDWFHNTDRVNAKKMVFDLYSPTVSDHNKVKTFMNLRNIAGANYQDNFKTYESYTSRTYQVLDFHLDFDIRHPDYGAIGTELQHAIFTERRKDPEEQGRQFNLDFARRAEKTFTSKGEAITDISFFDQFSQDERAAIFAICHQGVFPVFMNGEVCESKTHLLNYDISRDERGNLSLKIFLNKDIAADAADPGFDTLRERVAEIYEVKKSAHLEAKIEVIDPGNYADVNILSVNYYSQNGL